MWWGLTKNTLRGAREEIAGALEKIFVSSLPKGEDPGNWK